MDTIEQDIWAEIPGHSDYEANMRGEVRSWKPRSKKPDAERPAQPRMLKLLAWQGTPYYDLDGQHVSKNRVIYSTFGDLVEHIRELDQWQIVEIRECEGIKEASEVAADFRIDATRVRNIWDA